MSKMGGFDFSSFRLVRARGRLAERLAQSLEAAVRSGDLRPGERLPTVAEWAKALGVSAFVPRRAMEILSKRAVIEVKRHIGASVSWQYVQNQRKKVIFVSVDRGDIWARSVFSFRLGEELRKAGYRYERVIIPASGSVGQHSQQNFSIAPLADVLKEGVAFAWVYCSRPWVTEPLRAAGVPFAVFDFGGASYPGAVDVFAPDAERMARMLVSRLKAAKIASVALVAPGPEITDWFSSHLYASGIGFRKIRIDLAGRARSSAQWQRQAMKTFDELLSSGRERLPDVLFFSDDNIASGALLAMCRHGVESPRDVKVVTLSNKGQEPVYFRHLTRFESDPESNAVQVARYIVSHLKGKNPRLPDFSRRFIKGETL
jgi:DNA-binding LacI/PurR family transcriptional regulator